MKPFANTFANRKAAAMVLLAWLFALASGVANACLLETPATHAHAAAAESDGGRVVAVIAGHAGAVADAGHQSSATKAPCLKVCDDTSNAVVSQPNMTQADTGQAPLERVIWLVALADRVAPLPSGDPSPGGTKLPLRLQYARLAL